MTGHGAPLAEQLAAAADAPGVDLATPALIIARLEYPRLESLPYLERLERMGEAAASRMQAETGAAPGVSRRIAALNRYLFDELGFFGNRERYDDPRNSCLNEVLDRRTGIPLTLSIVYIEIARRTGLAAEGVNFPGHFLVRILDQDHPGQRGVIVDPFHAGAILEEQDCRQLLQRHVGDDAAFDEQLLAAATRRQILVRMLLNLKRLYVRMRSFPQAWRATDLLLTLSPSSLSELRDRGLLSYHMNDFSAALRDLELFLRRAKPNGDAPRLGSGRPERQSQGEEEKREMQQLWEHVKALKRRIASFN